MAGKITISDDCDREGEENMRKQKLMLGAILVAAGLLMGCAGTAKGSTEEDTGTAAVEEVQADENGNASTEEDTISEDENGLTAEAQTEDVESSDPGNSGENEQMDIYVILSNPSFSYYRSDRVQERELTAIALIKDSEEPNEIIDEDKWFQDNLSLIHICLCHDSHISLKACNIRCQIFVLTDDNECSRVHSLMGKV